MNEFEQIACCWRDGWGRIYWYRISDIRLVVVMVVVENGGRMDKVKTGVVEWCEEEYRTGLKMVVLELVRQVRREV